MRLLSKTVCLLALFVGLFIGYASCQLKEAKEVLNPPYFNLAEGRNISASATCGETTRELYCKLVGSNWLDSTEDVNLIEGQACDYCDPRDPRRSHPPQNAIDGSERWWQSPPLSRGLKYSEVNLTLDLGQEFHVAYVFIKMGNSPRPGVWVLERSRDYGKTFTPWQQFADTQVDCIQHFGQLSLLPITKDDQVICETKFSKLVPLEGGEIAIALLNGRPSADNFSISAALQDWSTATNIRLHFIRPKTTLGHLLSVSPGRQDPTVTRRYFYSVKDINIGGRCVCNGHASQCDQSSPDDAFKVSCSCQHNTCGTQCEQCCPGYQQYKWSRATFDNPFVCEKCNCNGHSEDCYFDPEVAENHESMNIHGKQEGGGVCRNCQHNTTGINCDKCRDGFYRPYGKLIDAIDVCQTCRCDLRFSTGNCSDGTGLCECRPNYQSPNCDLCSYGYYNYPECKECDCYRNGTAGNICEIQTGLDCPCLEGYGGPYCKKCYPEYFGFPECQRCECNFEHSLGRNCNVTSGQCNCKTNYGGRKCDQCSVGYYNYPSCQFCLCDRVGSTEQICDPQNGQCFCRPGYAGSACDRCDEGYYGYPNCVKCDCSPEGSSNQICDRSGKCQCKFNYGGLKCDGCSPGYFNFPKCIPCGCSWGGSIGQSCENSGKCICNDRFEGTKCDKCKEGYYNFPHCEECNCNPAGLIAEFGGCDKMEQGKLCECKPKVKGRICNQCKDLHWNLQIQNSDGCEHCQCNQNGTISGIGLCNSVNGQCMCKPNVQGRMCNMCKRNTYLLESSNLFGCVDCNCDIGGSIGTECDKLTGQCRCKQRIKGRSCSETIEAAYFPTLYQFLYETEDWFNPTGSLARFGYDEELFPGYSWRGYATFSHLQKEIFTNISISKPSIYRVIVNYVNLNNEPINALLKFTPNEWMNEDEQSIPIVFEPTKEPRRMLVTGKQLASRTFTLSAGPWRVSLKADKFDLYVDYVVLLPQPYYDQSLFRDKRTEPCKLVSSDSSCVKYSYPNYPTESNSLLATDAYTLDGDTEIKPDTEDNYREELQLDSPLVKLSNKTDNLLFDFRVPDNGSYLIMINYHTPSNINQSIKLEATVLDPTRNVTLESHPTLTACPYSFVCRQIFSDSDGEIFMLKEALKDDAFKLKLQLSEDSVNEDLDLHVHSVMIIPFGLKWSFDFVRPKFQCVLKNGTCASFDFPPLNDEIKIQAAPDRHNEESSLPTDIEQKSIRLDSTNPFDLRGSVPEPGSYSFVLHYYQPNKPSSEMEALIQNGQFYSGTVTLEHCPNIAGCRAMMYQRETNSSYFFIQKDFTLTLRTPEKSEVFLEYLLVVPGNSYKDQMLSLTTTDAGTNLMADCLQNNFYIEPNMANDYCRSSIFSITTDFNVGALPCQCNIDGSYDHKCKSFGGQCNCKPNVIGRDCSMCRTGYYGFPNCRKCNCPSTAICHVKTGDCICPKGVTGENCDKCLPFTFGFDKLIGCVDCACNPNGVENRNLNCDLETGACTCRSNIVGRKCDKCKAGFYGFPECQLCRCDIRGTTEDICNQRTAQCFCKKNVDGIYCDKCKDDSYYLEESNVLGCTKCFCFGTTDRCSSSPFMSTQVRTNNKEWEVYNVTVTEKMVDRKQMKNNADYSIDYVDGKIVITTNLLRETTHKEQDFDSAVYIALPNEFLGNRITSYGGRFQYRVMNKKTNENVDSVISPDIILIGQNSSLLHQHYEQPLINEEFVLSIRFHEKEFKHLDGRQVTREQLMMTLVRLQGIYLRIKYFDPIVEIVLNDVQMDVAFLGNRPLAGAPKALSVEQCNCPPGYKGTSCEECAQGYYRVKRGPYLGACSPCNCNGHSNECDPVTGKCYNCQYNTEGNQCERCIEGYHGDATRGTPHDCIICACPLPLTSNNFATSCEVSPSGSVLNCNCREGYNGTRCDYCAAGHFGQPQIAGGVCRKCECNNNIDVNDPDSCDPLTGICTKCLNKSSGEHCEMCAPWFYGDSVMKKNCTGCSCDQCGSEYCEHLGGDCKCKINVLGQLCDHCAPGHYGFDSCNGCKSCKCAEGAIGIDCDETGQCVCQKGISGKQCETCKPGYWGYSKYGCSFCKCNEKFSRATQCNLFTGQCQCLPGVIGEKCERCPDRWVLVPESGCQECGNCVHVLLNDTDELQSLIEPIQNDIQHTSSSVLANRKLENVKSKHADFSERLNSTFFMTPERTELLAKFSSINQASREIKDVIEKMDIKTDSLEKYLNNTNQKAFSSHNDLMEMENEVKSVKQFVAQVIENVNRLENSFLNASMQQEIDFKNKEGEKLLQELRAVNLQDYEDNLRISVFNEALEKASTFVKPSSELGERIESMSFHLGDISALVVELKNLTNKARESTINAENMVKDGLKDRIEDKLANIDHTVKQTEVAIRNAYDANANSSNAFVQFKQLKIDLDDKKAKLSDITGQLKEKMNEKSILLPEAVREAKDAVDHAKKIERQREELDNTFASTKALVINPLQAANAYKNISTAVDESEEIMKDFQKVESEQLRNFSLQDEISKTSQSMLDTERTLRKSTDAANEKDQLAQKIDESLQRSTEQFEPFKEKMAAIENMYTDLGGIEQIKAQADSVRDIEQKVNSMLQSVESLKERNKTMNRYSDFLTDVKEAVDIIKQINNANSSIQNYDPDYINQKQMRFRREKETISDKVNDLKRRIQIAKHQANNIRVGAQFTADSVLELNNPGTLAPASTYNKISLQFLSQTSDGLLAYIGNPVNSKGSLIVYGEDSSANNNRALPTDYMCLEIRNGHVTLTWDFGAGTPNILTDSQNVLDNNWHKTTIERFGKLVKLTVKTNNESTESKKFTEGDRSVFNLDAQASRIFVGGIAPDVEVSDHIANRHLQGFISNIMFDNEPLGLWNLKQSLNVAGSTEPELSKDNSMRFNGNSYVILQKPENVNFKESVFVSFNFKTFVKNGLLFLIGEPTVNEYLAIELHEGRVVLRYELGSAPVSVVSDKAYNDGNWHFVKVNRQDKESIINIGEDDEQTGFGLGMSTDLTTNDKIYIGGYPGPHTFYDVTKVGFDGCLKNLQIQSDPQNLHNHKESFGVLPGCSTDFVRTVSFVEQANESASSFVVNAITTTLHDNIQLTFKFVTLSKMGLLLHLSDPQSSFYFSVFLADGTLVLRTSRDETVRTDNHVFNDNKWHYVTVTMDNDAIQLSVDDSSTFSVVPTDRVDVSLLTDVFVGGLPPPMRDQFGSVFGNFMGCVGDITLNEDYFNFAKSTEKQNAQFSKCPLAGQENLDATPLLPKPSSNENNRTPAPIYLPPIGNCKLPPIPVENSDTQNLDEVRFGGTLWSRYEFSISNDISKGLENESGFQIKFKTTQSSGIIFYITSSNNIDFVGLYFVNHKLHYSFDCGSGRGVEALQKNYSDGQWHSATFSRKGRNGLLRVDDESVEVASVGDTSSLNVKSPIYVGGVPEQLSSQVKGHLKSADKDYMSVGYAMSSFAGCLKDLRVRDLEYKFKEGRGVDVAPCTDQVENGNFFHYGGGYIRLYEEFRVGVEFTLTIQVKPRKSEGILAAVFGKTDFLLLYIDKGVIVFSVDNGANPITSEKDVGDIICDGQWHTIKAIKTKNVVMLTVDDTETVYSLGYGGISSTDTKDTLFIGGLPNKIKEEKKGPLRGITDDFLGCLRIKEINNASPSFVKMEGHITLNSCPIA